MLSKLAKVESACWARVCVTQDCITLGWLLKCNLCEHSMRSREIVHAEEHFTLKKLKSQRLVVLQSNVYLSSRYHVLQVESAVFLLVSTNHHLTDSNLIQHRFELLPHSALVSGYTATLVGLYYIVTLNKRFYSLREKRI